MSWQNEPLTFHLFISILLVGMNNAIKSYFPLSIRYTYTIYRPYSGESRNTVYLQIKYSGHQNLTLLFFFFIFTTSVVVAADAAAVLPLIIIITCIIIH